MTSPNPAYREIPLTQGQVAMVDEADFVWLNQWKWHAVWNRNTASFYASRNSPWKDGKHHPLKMHRVILGLEKGDPRQADHRNHDTLDNRRENLRVATGAQNCANQRRARNNTSGHTGVSWDAASGKWMVYIRCSGKRRSLGRFTNKAEAAEAYRAAAISSRGDFVFKGEEDHAASLVQTVG